MNLTRFLTLFSLVVFSSCSTISGTLIAPDIQTPTVPGEEDLDIVVHTMPGRGATLFNDASSRPPNYSTNFESIQNPGSALVGGLSYGALKNLSFRGGLIQGDSFIDGVWGGMKAQVIGPSGVMTSDLILTAYGKVGFITGSRSGDNDGLFGPGGYPWEVDRSGRFINAGVSLGYQITPWFVPFVGYGLGVSRIEAELNQSAAGSSSGGIFKQSFQGEMKTWGGGVQFFGPVFQIQCWRSTC